MPETLSPPLSEPVPQQGQDMSPAQQWLKQADSMLGSPITLQKPDGSGPETFTLYDAVNKHLTDEHENPVFDANGNRAKTPTAILASGDGQKISMPVEQLLASQEGQLPKTTEATEASDSISIADTIPRSRLLRAFESDQKVEQAERVILPDMDAGIEQDPQIQELVGPGMQTITKMQNERHLALQSLQDSYAQGEQNDKYWDEVRKVEGYYDNLIQDTRNRLEADIKPIVLERVKQTIGDKGPAYAKPGETVVKDRKIVSKYGKQVSSYLPGNKMYESPLAPRLGQFSTPDRFSDWAGTGSNKTNEKTKVTSSSAVHVANLAAAMLAGNFVGESHPLEYARDEEAEQDLPGELKGKLKLYKVLRGQHRLAASRLVEGVDAVVVGTELKR